MTMFHGLGMFIFGMGALIVGSIVAYFIINEVMKEKKREEKMGRSRIKILNTIAFNIGYAYAYVKIRCQLLMKKGGIK